MFESLIALQVSDDEAYAAYREGMTPILTEYGGGFGYDFKVSEVLINPSGKPMNRVFTIYFPDEATADIFFADTRYLEVREKHFVGAVESITMIAEYKR